MEYRLIEDHFKLGITGQVLNQEQYMTVPFFDRPLLEPMEETGYRYVFFRTMNNKTVRYVFDSILSLPTFFDKVKGIDDWAKLAMFTAASEKKSYSYDGSNIKLRLEVHDTEDN
jgi:hypothetical protein